MRKQKNREQMVERSPRPEDVGKEESSAMSSEVEERLRRIEMAQARGSSDVMKFAFFFFLGIALTVMLYPQVHSTIESLKHERRGNDIAYEPRTNPEDAMVDVGEEDFEDLNKAELDDSQLESVSNESNHVRVGQPETADVLINHETPAIKKDEASSEQVRDVNRRQGGHSRNRREDSLIGEGEDFHDEVTVEETTGSDEPGITKERIELFSMDSDSEIGEERIELFSIDSDEMLTQPKPKTKEDKTQKAKQSPKTKQPTKKKQGTKKKENGKSIKFQKENTPSTDTSDEADKAIPPEVKNFKPTYLKNVTPKKIFADGRRIPPTELLPQKPNNSSVKVWMFEEFLSTEECDGLMRVHKQHVQEQSKDDPILCFDSITTLRKHLKNVKQKVTVTPRDFTDGTTCVNATFSRQLKDWFKGNWSYSTAFYPGESRFAAIFEQRVKQAMGLNPENGGKFQITSYPLGIGYKSHTDCTEDDDKRDRVATVLVYLDTVDEGGETDFPELGIWVRPRKARALVWNNMNEKGECEAMSIHKANMVKDGHKVILQRWYYYQFLFPRQASTATPSTTTVVRTTEGVM